METRERILRSALDLFSKQGYRATTTREIAREAGVNELTIFRHFTSKEKLLGEVMDFGFDFDGLKRSVETDLTGDAERDLEALAHQLILNMRERESIYALMFREMSTNEMVRGKLGELPGMVKDVFLRRLRQILRERARDDLDMETAGIFLASYFIRSEIMRIMMGKDPFHEMNDERIRIAIDIFLYGYLERGDET